jgi:hypothetical protein
MKQLINFNSPFTTSLFWGLLGGALLVLTSTIFDKGLLEILPYPIILILTFITFKPQTENKFQTLFLTGVLTFAIMSIIPYLNIVLVQKPGAVNINALGHLWRLGLILGIGGICSLLLTILVTQKK